MLTDEELIDRLRAGLAPLQPGADLIERLREQVAADRHHTPFGFGQRLGVGPGRLRLPGGVLALATSGSVAIAIAVGALVLAGHRSPGAGAARSTILPGVRERAHATAPALSQAHDRLLLIGAGLDAVSFGASPDRLQRLLDPLLGAPAGGYQSTNDCDVDHTLVWPILLNPTTGRLERTEELALFFSDRRFVGYQYGGNVLAPRGRRLRLRAITTRGLAIGDPLTTAQRLYGPALRISSAQGGTWQAHTTQGTIRGYAYGNPKHGDVSPSSLIASIDAGDVGCPALSP